MEIFIQALTEILNSKLSGNKLVFKNIRTVFKEKVTIPHVVHCDDEKIEKLLEIIGI